MEPLVLHMTRGILAPTLDKARAAHNAFVSGGPQPGIDIARSLGDVSHNVYAPVTGVEGDLTAEPGELLFMDYWANPNGMEAFFANPFAVEAGDRLYASREESEWTPAVGGFDFCVPVPQGAAVQYIAMMRASVRSAEDAVAALGKLVRDRVSAARKRGQTSHALFTRVAEVAAARPAANGRRERGERVPESGAPIEILALDSWLTLEGLQEDYGDAVAMNGLYASALAEPPKTPVWQQQPGFTEW
jgi:hypothetical protein